MMTWGNLRGMRTGTAVLACVVIVLVGASAAATAPRPSVGYIGCSNTRDTVEGYHAAAGSRHLLWPGTRDYKIGGGNPSDWANPGDPRWLAFTAMVRIYGTPAVVWVQLCPGARSRYGDVQLMLQILHRQVPSATVYVSPINSYSPPGLCMSTQRYAQSVAWADQAVREGLALRGPGDRRDGAFPLGPLTANLVTADRCHPSGSPQGGSLQQGGKLVLGRQLALFFDRE